MSMWVRVPLEVPIFEYVVMENPKNHRLAVELNQRFLAWLTRRYCLVEKENIKRYFQSRNYILTHQDKYKVYIVRESEVEMKLLRCLFPEIAKEVES